MRLSSRLTARRVVGLTVALAASAGLLVGVSGTAGGLPPKPKPKQKVTQQQVDQAHSAQDAVATKVGQLGAQLAQEQAALDASRGRQQLAEQKVALAVSQLDDARTAAVTAKTRVRAANQTVVAAHTKFIAYVQASYADGTVTGTTGSLLTAQDPNALVDRSTLEKYQQATQVSAIGVMQAATVGRSNAEAAARRAVADITVKTAKAKQAKAEADREYFAEQVTQQQLLAAQATARNQLIAAQQELALRTQGRTAYLTFLQQKAAYNQAVAAAAAAAAAKAAADRERARQIAEQAAARKHHRHHHGGGGGGQSFAPPVSSGPSPGGGGWTAAKGRLAAHRALKWLGDLYIFAGGNRYGPTDGGCTDPVAPCGTVGFDCSGLVLYAWDRGWDHYANTQYSQAGSYHPSPGHFKPGDLLFWSEGGQLGHVAIYIGHGDVVQAPQSGDVVKVTPWQQVQSGYYGATRPLT